MVAHLWHWSFVALLVSCPNLFAHTPESASCPEADRIRMQMYVTASNIVNVNTTRVPEGGPYQKKKLNCTDMGCTTEQSTATVLRYEPHHPDADANGYVSYPDINLEDELLQLEILKIDYTGAVSRCSKPNES